MNFFELVRAAYGLCQLVRPDFIPTKLLHHELDARSMRVVRVLGARHLIQATTILLTPRSTLLHAGGAMVDFLHASTMVVLAIFDGRRRKAALADAAIAGVFAAVELRESASSRSEKHRVRSSN